MSPLVIAYRASTLQNGMSLPVRYNTDTNTEPKSIPHSRPFFLVSREGEEASKQSIKRTVKVCPRLSQGDFRS